MVQDGVKVYKQAKRELGLYPAILIEQVWSMKDLLYGKTILICMSEQDSAVLPTQVASQSQCRIWFILPAHGASHIKMVL